MIVRLHEAGVLDAVDGNKSRAADVLGSPRTSLYHKIRKYRIEGEPA